MAVRGNNRTRSRAAGPGGGSASGGGVAPVIPITASQVGYHDSTNTASYSGTGGVYNSLIAVPADGTSQANNVMSINGGTFVGGAGSQAAYILEDGTSNFSQTAASLTSQSMLLNMHRTDIGKGWVALVLNAPNGDATNRALFGTCRLNSGSDTGLGIIIGTDAVLRVVQRNGAGQTIVLGPGVNRLLTSIVLVSWDCTQATGYNVRFWVDTTTKWQAQATWQTSTVATTLANKIGQTGQLLANGTQVKADMYGNSFIDDGQAAQIFALFQTAHGVDYTYGGAYSQTRILNASLLGDSGPFLNQLNTQGTATDYGTNNTGPFTWYNNLANHRFEYPAVNNVSVAGENSTTCASRLIGNNQMVGRVFDQLWIRTGANDLLKNTSGPSQAATVIANLGSMYDYAVNILGKNVIAETILPVGNWLTLNSTQIAQGKADRLTINTWIRSQDGSRGGKVRVSDVSSAIDDGTGVPIANSMIDGLHPSGFGGYTMGVYELSLFSSIFGTFQPYNFASNNLITNQNMSGTSGTVTGTGVSGSVATGYALTVTGGAGTTGTVVGSKPTSTQQQIAISYGTGGTSNVSAQLSQAITTGFAVFDIVFAAMLITITSPTNIVEGMLDLVLSGTGTSGATDQRGMSMWTTNDNVYGVNAYVLVPVAEAFATPGQYLVQTTDLFIAAGTGLTLTAIANLTGGASSGAAASGNIIINNMGIFNRTNLPARQSSGGRVHSSVFSTVYS